MAPSQPRRQFFSVNPLGHQHVGQEQVNRARMLVPKPRRRDAVWSLHHGVAVFLQNRSRQGAPAGVVLHDHNGFRAALGNRPRARPARRPVQVPAGGQENLKRRSAPRIALHPQRAAGLLDNAENGGQTEAGALAGFFRRKQRLEDPGEILRRDAAARVRDTQKIWRVSADQLNSRVTKHQGVGGKGEFNHR
jgi:hypothetical protein